MMNASFILTLKSNGVVAFVNTPGIVKTLLTQYPSAKFGVIVNASTVNLPVIINSPSSPVLSSSNLIVTL